MALTDNLISYWKLDETTGDRVDSVVASGNDLSVVNTVGYGTGIISNAASFDATNQQRLKIDDGDQTGLDITGDHSYSFWINMASVPTYFAIAGKDDGYTSGYELMQASGLLYINFASAPATYAQWNATALEAGDIGDWVHIVVTVDVSSATGGIIYKNGSPLSMSAKGGTATSVIGNTVEFHLGGRAENARTINGLLDEVGFWSRVLTSDEVTELYNSGAGLTYPFTGPSGPANLKTYNTNAKANIKTINTNPIANVKTLNTNA